MPVCEKKNKYFSEATRRKMREAWTPERRAKTAQLSRKRMLALRASIPDIKKRDEAALKKAIKRAAELKRNRPFEGRELQAVLKNLEKAAQANAKATRFISKIEMQVRVVLKELGVRFAYHKVFGYFTTDFYLPAHKIDLECDGGYWHDRPDAKEKDARKRQYLKERGIRLVSIKVPPTADHLQIVQILKKRLLKEGVL